VKPEILTWRPWPAADTTLMGRDSACWPEAGIPVLLATPEEHKQPVTAGYLYVPHPHTSPGLPCHECEGACLVPAVLVEWLELDGTPIRTRVAAWAAWPKGPLA
jgi:hypothetical protein